MSIRASDALPRPWRLLRNDPTVPLTVLDPGPIPLAALEGDTRDIEPGLEQAGFDQASTATFRLVEIAVTDIEDFRWLPGSFKWGTEYVQALREGALFPPVVIMAPHPADSGYGLIDGLSRLHAHWALGRSTIRGYELLDYRPAVSRRRARRTVVVRRWQHRFFGMARKSHR